MQFDLAHLFDIDMDAQLANLASSSFRARWHAPVELVRDSLARGAKSILMRLTRRCIVLHDNGATLDPALLSAIARLTDRSRPSLERQTALVEIENLKKTELLVALLQMDTVKLHSGHHCLLLEKGRLCAHSLSHEHSSEYNFIELERKGTWRQELANLQEHCRFSPISIMVNDRAIGWQHSPPAAVLAARVDTTRARASGLLWLPLHGDSARVWLLRHGIRQRLIVPKAPLGTVFEAAIEVYKHLDAEFDAYLRELAQQLYTRMVELLPKLSTKKRLRAQELLFAHWRATRDDSLLARAPLFATLSGSRVDLAKLRKLGPTLWALDAEQDITLYDTADRLVLLLDEQAREFLSLDIGLRLISPPVLDRKDLRPRWRLADIGRFLHELVSRKPSTLARILLTPDESLLAQKLERVITDNEMAPSLTHTADIVSVDFCEGVGRPSFIRKLAPGRCQLVLNRNHLLVRAAIKQLAKDESSLTLVTTALLG